jgi:hypothetical protein
MELDHLRRPYQPWLRLGASAISVRASNQSTSFVEPAKRPPKRPKLHGHCGIMRRYAYVSRENEIASELACYIYIYMTVAIFETHNI